MTHFAPCLIETTTATRAEAKRIAQILLEQKLAACVQCEPIHSYYLWQDKLEEAAEIRLSIKSATHLYPAIEKVILAAHTYECPQILMLPISGITPHYRRWLSDNLCHADETAALT